MIVQERKCKVKKKIVVNLDICRKKTFKNGYKIHILSGASKRNPACDKVWVQGAGTQGRPDLRDCPTRKGVRTSEGFS